MICILPMELKTSFILSRDKTKFRIDGEDSLEFCPGKGLLPIHQFSLESNV